MKLIKIHPLFSRMKILIYFGEIGTTFLISIFLYNLIYF